MHSAAPLYPWHIRVLRRLVRHGPQTVAELGAAIYPASYRAAQAAVALHELLELAARGLVDRDHGRPERWHPALFAAEAAGLTTTEGGNRP